MKWALIGVPALALAGIGIAGPAEALPAPPSGIAITAVGSLPLLPAAHHRHRSRTRQAGDSASATSDPGGVKLGQWEFTTRLEAFATPQSPQVPSRQASPTLSGSDATYLSCIQSDRPVPFQFDGAQCKLDSRDRQGPRISWSMTCTNPQGAVRSDGVAQYHGDTMDGTLINHYPGANGKVTDLTQRITGRYLGPCPQVAQAAPTTPHANAAPEAAANAAPHAATGSSAQWVEPPAAPGGAKPAASAGTVAPPAASSGAAKPSAAPREAATAAPAEVRPAPRARYAQHRRHYYRRYHGYSGGYSGGGWPGGGGLFGIRIPFLGGL